MFDETLGLNTRLPHPTRLRMVETSYPLLPGEFPLDSRGLSPRAGRLFSAFHFLCAATKKGRLTASKRLWQQSQNCVRLGILQFRQPM